MKKKKLLASFLLVFVLALPFVAQAATSYSYYSFKYILTSKNYSFSSGSVSLETYNKEVSNSRSGLSDTFSITLYDSKGKSKGSRTQDLYASQKSSWSLDSKGTYFFRWVKADDGAIAKGKVEIKN